MSTLNQEEIEFLEAKRYFLYGIDAMEKKSYETAVSAFNKSLSLVPDRPSTLSNLAGAQIKLFQYEAAHNSAKRSVMIDPNMHEAWMNYGIASHFLGRYDEALRYFKNAIEIEPNFPDIYMNQGNTLATLKQLSESLVSYRKALELKPELDNLLGAISHTKMQLCDWSEFDEDLTHIQSGIIKGKKLISPFPLLSLIDDPNLQLRAVMLNAQNTLDTVQLPSKIPRREPGKKIRIGYYSPDFRSHPVGYLTVGLFEAHDRNKFELIAFSYKHKPDDNMQQRIIHAFDRFIDASKMTSCEVVEISRQLNIDIAVDLAGHTNGARPDIFSMRAAPVQLSYLGYPGTLGMECMDYIIADDSVIRPGDENLYTEKVCWLPISFFVTSYMPDIYKSNIRRTNENLPESGFVYCCFNNSYKINPDIFDIWMRVLKKTEGSVLWLAGGVPQAVSNLKNEAEKRGVSATRLVFADRTKTVEEHLCRLKLADLFLDTLPYNAHTTAADALWAGLPVLTRVGRSFQSRVAASLLNALDLPELIMKTADQYEQYAIEMANNPNKLFSIKQKLSRNKPRSSLFDCKSFAHQIEAAYTKMHRRYQNGLQPENMHITGQ